VPSQRDVMRDIFRRHRGDEEAIVREYAAAEVRGEVIRSSNEHDLSPEELCAPPARGCEEEGLDSRVQVTIAGCITNAAPVGRSKDLRMLRIRFFFDSPAGELGR
jgi:hypothetical protein